MSRLNRISALEFQIKPTRRPFRETASAIRTEVARLGFDFGLTGRYLNRENMNTWIDFIKSSTSQRRQTERRRRLDDATHRRRMQGTLQAIRQRSTPQPVFSFHESNKIIDNSARYTQVSYRVEVVRTISTFQELVQSASIIVTQLNEFIQRAIRDHHIAPDDKMQFVMVSENDRALSTGPVRPVDLSGDMLLDKLRRLMDDYEHFTLNEATQVYIQISRKLEPEGNPVGARSKGTNEKEHYKHQSVMTIDGGVKNSCFLQAVVIGIAKHREKVQLDELKVPDYANLTKSRHKQKNRERAAEALAEYCNVACGPVVIPDDIPKFEKALDMDIIVFDLKAGLMKEYPMDNRVNPKLLQVYLIKNGDHVDLVTKPHALFGRQKWCNVCFTGYTHTHMKCNQTCARCMSEVCMKDEDIKEVCDQVIKLPSDILQLVYEFEPFTTWDCEGCNQKFKSKACFDRHLERQICVKRTYCKTCHTLYNRQFLHECGKKKCPNCKREVDLTNHKCYIQKISKKNLKLHNYIFYDCESFVHDDNKPHEPFLWCAEYGDSDVKFQFSTTDEFCQWLFQENHAKFTAIAHNARSYDFQFIRHWCMQNGVLPKAGSEIYNGTKLITCTISKVRFIDSLSFIGGSLGGFAKTFGLDESKFSKGYFPYKWVTPENLHLTHDGLPDLKWFDFDRFKSEKERGAALKWYEENKNKPFNPWEEAVKYCQQDVNILKQGCNIFRDIFIKISDIDPFQSVTIASVCHKIYLTDDIPENAIAVIPNKSNQLRFRGQEEYLKYYEHRTGRQLERQRQIFAPNATNNKPLIVDGFDKEEKRVVEFNGCYFHGCQRCYKSGDFNTKLQTTMGSLFNNWKTKERRLKGFGYDVEVIWECEWNLKKKQIAKEHWEVEDDILDIRDAIKGGRTEVFKTYAVEDESTEINYYDYVSLYPSVMKGRMIPIAPGKEWQTSRYPIGHPQYLKKLKNEEVEAGLKVDKYYGFIKCVIEPPKDLRFPVLGDTFNGKFKFILCQKCEEGLNKANCSHSSEERALTGTWTTIEVKKALEKGYRLLRVLCLAHFPETYQTWDEEKERYEFSDTSANLFTSYIDRFFALKDQATREGNAGMRTIAKLCLNNKWGKFAQREIMSQRETVNGRRCHELIHKSTDIEVSDFTYLQPNMYSVEYKKKLECAGDSYQLSPVIGAYTTSLARLRLYEALEILGDDLIYCDTDSVIFQARKGESPKVFSSDEIGAFKDELNGDKITEVVCMAPKTYAYRTQKGKLEVKSKGFVLSLQNQVQVNMESYKQMVNGQRKTIQTKDMRFQTYKHSGLIQTKEIIKEMQYNYDKRIVRGYETFPIGFVSKGRSPHSQK